MILRGERMPGTEDGPPPVSAWRGAECGVTAGYHRPGGSGDGRPASAARPSGLPPERARHGRRPECGQWPRLPAEPVGPGVPRGCLAASAHAFPSRSLRVLLRCVRAEARRWRAAGAPLKKVVKKVVTAPSRQLVFGALALCRPCCRRTRLLRRGPSARRRRAFWRRRCWALLRLGRLGCRSVHWRSQRTLRATHLARR